MMMMMMMIVVHLMESVRSFVRSFVRAVSEWVSDHLSEFVCSNQRLMTSQPTYFATNLSLSLSRLSKECACTALHPVPPLELASS